MAEIFGTVAAASMVVCYALEERGAVFTVAFAASCLGAAGYAVAIGSWPFTVVETVWAGVAAQRAWRRYEISRRPTPNPKGVPMQKRASSTSNLESQKLDPAAVCTLTPVDLDARRDWFREEILPHAIETVRLESGLAVELCATPELVEKVDRLIELERHCCSGIVFERLAGATADRVRLEIRGIDPDTSFFDSPAQPRGGALRRLAKSAGVGVAVSLFVCCVLPIAAAALVGAAAAPLAGLDRPLPIAAGAILGSVAAWRWTRRSGGDAASDAAESGGDCGDGC